MTLPDGRILEFCRSGPEDASQTLVFHVGTPSAAVVFPHVTDAAAARGVGTLSYSRPGHGASTPHPGRTVAEEAATTAALADHLGVERFLVAGWSGGGPAALACAALLPDRALACCTLASNSPAAEVGPTWFAWFRPEDAEEFHTLEAPDGAERVRPAFEEAIASDASLSAEGIVQGLGVTEVERAALEGSPGLAEAITDSIRRATMQTPDGWIADEAALVRPWGFSVADVRVPVTIRHGELDHLVRIEHGRWLGEHVAGARTQIFPDGGHTSVAAPFDGVIDDLLEAARGR